MAKTESKQLVISYDTESHEIDFYTFAGSMLAFADALHEISRVVSAEKTLGVNIVAPREGSVEIVISINDVTTYALGGLFAANASYLKDIAELFLTMLKIKVFLKDKPPKSSEQEGENTVIINQNGERGIYKTTIVNNYFSNPQIEGDYVRGFKALVSDSTVKTVKFTEPETQQTVEAESADFEYLSEKNEVFSGERRENKGRAKLTIVSVIFEGTARWKFRFSGRDILAKIKDENFLTRVQNRNDGFFAGDILDVEMNIIEERDSPDGLFIAKSYEILKVHAHTPLGKQIPLNLKEKSENDENSHENS